MHLDDESLQRLLDGELDDASRPDVARHLEQCAECRMRLDSMGGEERWMLDLLRHTEPPSRAVDVAGVARRARGRAVAVWARRAAGIVVAIVAAGAAYTAPGSPVRGWVHQIAARVAGPAARDAPSAPGDTTPVMSGIAITPGPRLTIRFLTTQASGSAAVSLTDGSKVVVRARNGVATFTTDAERLMIENGGSTADYEIELPRGAPWVAIEIAGRPAFSKQGAHAVAGTTPDARGRFLLSLAKR